jgi:FixJ family two-component response regulator
VETLTDLSAQEAQIAKFARDGHTNQEIAAQLLLDRGPFSVRTMRQIVGRFLPRSQSTGELVRVKVVAPGVDHAAADLEGPHDG